jgi:hypothetical protein
METVARRRPCRQEPAASHQLIVGRPYRECQESALLRAFTTNRARDHWSVRYPFYRIASPATVRVGSCANRGRVPPNLKVTAGCRVTKRRIRPFPRVRAACSRLDGGRTGSITTSSDAAQRAQRLSDTWSPYGKNTCATALTVVLSSIVCNAKRPCRFGLRRRIEATAAGSSARRSGKLRRCRASRRFKAAKVECFGPIGLECSSYDKSPVLFSFSFEVS